MTPVRAYKPVQIHMTTYTNISQTQIQYKLDDARNSPKTQILRKMLGTPGCYACEHSGEENYKVRGGGGAWTLARCAGPRGAGLLRIKEWKSRRGWWCWCL